MFPATKIGEEPWLSGCSETDKSDVATIKYKTISPNLDSVSIVLIIYWQQNEDVVLRDLLEDTLKKYPRGFFQHDGTDIERINIQYRNKTIELSQGMLPVNENEELNNERAFFEKFRKVILRLSAARVRESS